MITVNNELVRIWEEVVEFELLSQYMSRGIGVSYYPTKSGQPVFQRIFETDTPRMQPTSITAWANLFCLFGSV